MYSVSGSSVQRNVHSVSYAENKHITNNLGK